MQWAMLRNVSDPNEIHLYYIYNRSNIFRLLNSVDGEMRGHTRMNQYVIMSLFIHVFDQVLRNE